MPAAQIQPLMHGIRSTMKLFIVGVTLASVLAADTPSAPDYEFFENKIRPVLAENCYECHNSVDQTKGDIALDYRDALVRSQVITPGDPAASRLIQALRHAEGVEPMPAKAPQLANIIIKNFEDWIRRGAPDPRIEKPTKEQLESQVDWKAVREQRKSWWSFQPIDSSPPAKATDPEWDGSAIDRFIHESHNDADLVPSPVAAPAQLLRRLYFVLTGLPPTPAAVEQFANDPSPEAYAKVVETLLTSPRFGERWARYWMDWFRYAETHGSEGDPGIPHAAQYRDYLIRALNADVGYDQLIREHIAGDLLKQPRINHALGLNESAIGPAHFRLSPQGFGVTDAYEEQITFTDNQIDVFTKATLGLTVSCARCHNHKFDPISQKDFYRLYGIMISSRPAIINVDSPARQERHQTKLRSLKKSIQEDLVDYWKDQVHHAVDQLMEIPFEAPKKPKEDEELTPTQKRHLALNQEITRYKRSHPLWAWKQLSTLEPEAWTSALDEMWTDYQNDLTHNAACVQNATFYADLRDQGEYDRWFYNGNGLAGEVSPAGAFALSTRKDRILAGIYPAGVYTHLLSTKHSGTLGSIFHRAQGDRTEVRAIGHNATARFSVRSYPLTHGGLHPAPTLSPNWQWTQIKKYLYWNNEQGYYQFETALDKTALSRARDRSRSWFGIAEVYAGSDRMRLIGAPLVAARPATKDASDLESLRKHYREALLDAVNGWRDQRLSDVQAEFLDTFVRHGLLPNHPADVPPALAAALAQYRELEEGIPTPHRAPGVIEGEPWDQPLLTRGSYRKEAEPVQRSFLEAFDPTPYDSQTSGRKELAEDLVAGNPLVPRVIVNRLWHHVFGRGIVTSVDNFGRLGSVPSHPALLDYLAEDLIANHWSLKNLLRQLVMSRTFRGSSTVPTANASKDPENRYLAHFTPRRLDAEAVLDTIRFVSGTLDSGRPQLSSSGRAQHRAIYHRVRRNFLDPFLTAFNAPVPTTTVGKRNLTNVPAQALVLMNGNIAREAAESWSQAITTDTRYGDDADRIQHLFLQAYSRQPTPAELALSLDYVNTSATDPSDESGGSRASDRFYRLTHALLNSKELIYVY